VEQKAGHFHPEKFEDHYENTLKDFLKKMQHGQKTEATKGKEPSKIINLMNALCRSANCHRCRADSCARKMQCTEACLSAHFVSRALRQLGHEPRIIPAIYVKPFVKGQKNDYNDAEAIAEAALRPNLRVVREKPVTGGSNPTQVLEKLYRCFNSIRVGILVLSGAPFPPMVKIASDQVTSPRPVAGQDG
jgi:hypothetical protein